MRLSLAFNFIYISLPTLLACGVTTHIAVGNLALSYLEGISPKVYKLIQSNLAAYQAGSFFPDWGYICRKFENEGEFSHWPGFYEASIQFLKLQYGNELNSFLKGELSEAKTDKERKFSTFLSFILGAINHGVGDILYHSLDRTAFGLIHHLRDVNFDGNYDKAHNTADVGGDVLIAHAYDLDYIKSNWDIPTNDLIAVYKNLGYDKITWLDLRSCMSIGLAAAQATKVSGGALFGKFDTDKAPFLVRNHHDYYHGGIYSMALRVRICMDDVVGLLDGSLTINGFCNGTFVNSDTKSSQGALEYNPRQKVFSSEASYLTLDNTNSKYEAQVGRNQIQYIAPKQDDKAKQLMEDSLLGCKVWDEDKLKENKVLSNWKTSEFGYQIENFKLKDQIYLAVSAPFAYDDNTFYVPHYPALGKVEIYNLNYKLIQTLTSPTNYGHENQYGYALTTLDIDDDGFEDLIIGAPSTSTEVNDYIGKVYIHLGTGNGDFNEKAEFEITLKGQGVNKDKPIRFGEKLFKTDIDGDGKQDLIISSPSATINGISSGIVCAYLTPFDVKKNNIEPNWCITSPTPLPFQRFGHSIQPLQQLNQTYLLISSPSDSLLNTANSVASGSIYIVELKEGQAGSITKLAQAEDIRAGFGMDFVVIPKSSDQMGFSLVVGSPDAITKGILPKFQAGVVELLNFKPTEQPSSFTLGSRMTLLKGTAKGGSLGTSIQAYSKNDATLLLVSEPLGAGEDGILHAISLKGTKKIAQACLKVNAKKARLGAKLLLNGEHLWTTAPHYPKDKTFVGAIINLDDWLKTAVKVLI